MNPDQHVTRRVLLQALAAGTATLTTGARGHPNTTGSNVVQEPRSRAAAFPTVNVKTDCGAAGDGVTNDTSAFQQAAQIIQAAGGGTLDIPPGVYIVCRQHHDPNDTRYYRDERPFDVQNLSFLYIEGHGSTLRLPDGLHYGSFDPDTGERYDPPTLPFTDRTYQAALGFFFRVRNSSDVTVSNIQLDGNNENLVLGGLWGNRGRQIPSHGLLLVQCTSVHVDNVHTHHHALDGVTVRWPGLAASDPATPHTLTDVVSEYNGRQGLSWTGGRGLSCHHCTFSHTGRGGLASGPGAGVDIEATGAVCRDGHFENCEFINNTGVGMVAASGDGGYSQFIDCTFWGTTNWSIWCAKPGLQFHSCTMYGDAVHTFGSSDPELATRFNNCHFEDMPWTNGNVHRRGYLYQTNEGGENVTWDGCTFVANGERSLWLGSGTSTSVETVTGCTVTHKYSGLPDGSWQAILRGASISSTHFTESFPEGTTSSYYLSLTSVTVEEGSQTIVDGPLVKWGNPTNGITGVIPPGTYG